MIRVAVAIFCLTLISGCASDDSDAMAGKLLKGSGVKTFDGMPGKRMRVFYHRPVSFEPDGLVLIALHGVGRNAEGTRDSWRNLSGLHGFLLIAPEFSKDNFPGGRRYARGNMRLKSGALNPAEEWSFNAVEKLFDEVRGWSGGTRGKYLLFGHSAEGQFVHRMITFMPNSRIERAVAANAGWYAMPDENEDFPYGLKGADIADAQLSTAFAHNLTVMLGDADANPDSKNLNRGAGAMKQGEHRLARGLNYFDAVKLKASKMDVPFAWRLEIVPGAGHSTNDVKAAAVLVLLQIQR